MYYHVLFLCNVVIELLFRLYCSGSGLQVDVMGRISQALWKWGSVFYSSSLGNISRFDSGGVCGGHLWSSNVGCGHKGCGCAVLHWEIVVGWCCQVCCWDKVRTGVEVALWDYVTTVDDVAACVWCLVGKRSNVLRCEGDMLLLYHEVWCWGCAAGSGEAQEDGYLLAHEAILRLQ